MKTIIKLTNEYASNLNCLFFDFDKRETSYYDMFAFIFKDCLLLDNRENIKYEHFNIIDIVFIKINDASKFKNHKDIKMFINSLRKKDELLPVYLIGDDITNLKVLEMINACYCLDGLLPTPFDRDRIYRFLYRILKRLTVLKELNAYVENLEEQLFISPVKIIEEEPKNQVIEIKKRDESREKDIRFSQTEKISAVEFMNLLDDTVVDKVENMGIELDALIGVIYGLESANASSSVAMIEKNIEPIINNVFVLVESMGYFAVVARAFRTLNAFLATLGENELENKEGKNLFITMLLAIINDLEKWLQIIFIEQSAEDIHYLDASFSSNVLEIEQVFLESTDEDEDDLEFF